MDPGPSISINVAALAISMLAVGLSSFIALRQTTLARQANQITTFVEFLSEVRSAKFRRRERAVWEKLPTYVSEGGFAQLSRIDRTNVEVVCSYYSALAYCIAIGALDHYLALVPIYQRLLRTWDCVYPLLQAERANRAGDSYFSLLEDMVEQAKRTNFRTAEHLLSRRTFPDIHTWAARRRRRRDARRLLREQQ